MTNRDITRIRGATLKAQDVVNVARRDQPKDAGHAGTSRACRRYTALAKRLRAGHRHPTLSLPEDWDADVWQSGRARVATLVETFAIKPAHRVIDYGCGTLRLGAHLIGFLDRGNYFGLDVAPDLIALGSERVNAEILSEKVPLLAGIDEHALARAQSFQAAFLISESVSFHVFPDELDFYYAALRRLVAVPGSVLILGTRLADVEIRFADGSWARPLQHFVEALAPLTYLGAYPEQVGGIVGKRKDIKGATLAFRREGGASGMSVI